MFSEKLLTARADEYFICKDCMTSDSDVAEILLENLGLNVFLSFLYGERDLITHSCALPPRFKSPESSEATSVVILKMQE